MYIYCKQYLFLDLVIGHFWIGLGHGHRVLSHYILPDVNQQAIEGHTWLDLELEI